MGGLWSTSTKTVLGSAAWYAYDSDMGRGIKIRGELLANPDARQKATFVAMNLIRALKQDNQPIIFSSCAYLVNRLPALVEVRANDQGDTVNIDLVEEH